MSSSRRGKQFKSVQGWVSLSQRHWKPSLLSLTIYQC
uniref:Uncharacterized protein n=1 Tax=Anguilla anguilla TaxID=7936 RepID=A0A0E9WMS8_ANGAN